MSDFTPSRPGRRARGAISRLGIIVGLALVALIVLLAAFDTGLPGPAATPEAQPAIPTN